MARTPDSSDQQNNAGNFDNSANIVLSADGQDRVELPNAEFVKNADMSRDGQDLILETPNGETVVIEGYFSAVPAPLLQAPTGEALTAELIESFVMDVDPVQVAQAGNMSDASPVGAVDEITGEATVTRADGTVEPVTIGTPIYEGDVIETSTDGALNIVFIDETSFAVAENAKMAIDEFVFDPETESGSQDFSVLRGLFVFTSGLIGRDDPDDVNIDTPMGSIGIRGTVIIGNANTGEITVKEGAIVMRSFDGNEYVMADEFQSARFDPVTGEIVPTGIMNPTSFFNDFGSLKFVAPDLFSGIEPTQGEDSGSNQPQDPAPQETQVQPAPDSAPAEAQEPGSQDGSADAQPSTGLQPPPPPSGSTALNPEGQSSGDLPPPLPPQENDQNQNMNLDPSIGQDAGFDGTGGAFDSGTNSGTGTGLSSGSTGTGGSTQSPPPPSGGNSGAGSASSTGTQTTNPPPPPTAITNFDPTGTGNANLGTSTFAQSGYERHFSSNTQGTFSIAGAFTDPNPTDILTFSKLSTDPANVTVTVTSAGLVTFNVGTLGVDTPLDIVIQASDGRGGTASATFSVNLLAPDIGGTTTSAVNQALNGSVGADTFNVNHDNAILFGYGDDDTFNISSFGNYIYADTGIDTVNYAAHAVLTDGIHLTLAGAGPAIVDYQQNASFDVLRGIENVTGSAYHDQIHGDAQNNIIGGAAGNDQLHGGAGDDTLIGGTGNDTLSGGTGNDTLNGGDGDDTFIVQAGDGNDTVTGGGAGETNGDTYDATGVTSDFTVDLANNSIVTVGSNDTVSQVENILLGSGNDTIIVSSGGTPGLGQDHHYDGGAGLDHYDASTWVSGPVTFNFSSGTIQHGALIDTFANIERFTGGTGNDIFILNTGGASFVLDGSGGTDELNLSAATGAMSINLSDTNFQTIGGSFASQRLLNFENVTGGGFDDIIRGNASDNTINAGAGDDIMFADAGADTYDGGAGSDTVNYSTSAAAVNVNLGTGTGLGAQAQGDTYVNIENVIGSDHGDTLTGDAVANALNGGAGNDTLIGGAGADTLDGGAGIDTADYSGSAAAVNINLSTNTHSGGDAAGDSLLGIENVTGSAFNDTIVGDAGNNVIDGGTGSDNLFGGDGDDTLIIDTDTDNADGDIGSDTLRFSNTGTYTINASNVTDIETIDAQNSAGAQNITVQSGSTLLTQDTVFNLDANDTLMIDFAGLGYTLSGGFIDTDSSGTQTYTNGANTITVNFDAGAATRVTANNLETRLNLNNGSLNVTDGFRITDNIGEGFGYSIAAMGDRNNDGFTDLAFGKQNNPNDDGRIFTLNGSTSLTDTTAPSLAGPITGLLNSTAADNVNNMVIASGGDFDGDGFMDYIIGAENASNNTATISGNAQIISGQNGSVLASFDNFFSGDQAGKSVSFIGDIDGDGLDDVAIGAPGVNGTEGKAYILTGGNTGTNIDVQSLTQIAHEGDIGLGADGVRVVSGLTDSGSTLFVATNNGQIRILNTNDPSSITGHSVINQSLISGFGGATNQGVANGVADIAYLEHDSLLFILTGNNGPRAGQITVLDVSDPAAPTFVDQYAAPNLSNATKMQILPNGELAVITNNGANGTFALLDFAPNGDIAGPSGSPLNNNTLLSGAQDMAFYNNHVFVVTGFDNDGGGANTTSLQIVDVTGGTPAIVADFGFVPDISAIAIDKVTDSAFIVTANGTLHHLDISTPSAPTQPYTFISDAVLSGATDIVIDIDGIAYITTPGGTIAVDVNDPATWSVASIIGEVGPGTANDDNGTALTIDEDGFLFVTSGGASDNLSVFDLQTVADTLSGAISGDLMGQNVSSAGDFNNDGFADFLVSKPGADSAYLVLGNEFGIYDESEAITITGLNVDAATNDVPLIDLGDVSGDGISDIAVASTNGMGEIHVINGGTSRAAGQTLTAGWGNSDNMTIRAASGFEIIGGAAAGDFNGDGIDDIAVAISDTATDVSIYVIYGGQGNGVYINDLSGNFDLTDNNVAFAMRYTLDSSADEIVLSSAGDVNGDGFADLAIGAPDNNAGDGEVIVVYGREGGTTLTNVADNATVSAGGAAERLVSGDGSETISDGGNNNVSISSGAGNDRLQISNDQFDNLDGGGGYDVLELQGAGTSVDFTAIGSERFENIEAIDMSSDTGEQTVVLGLDDVFDMMKNAPDTDGAGGDPKHARIDGGANDIFVIEMPGFFGDIGVLSDNNVSAIGFGEGFLDDFGTAGTSGAYQTFSFNGYELWISNDLISNNNVVIAENVVNGTLSAADQTLIGTQGVDNVTVNQNGASVFGFAGDDVFNVTNNDFSLINGGAGNDTLVAGATLDLRTIRGGDISGIETIDLGGNTLTLSIDNLREIAEANGTNMLNIVGSGILEIDDYGTANDPNQTTDAGIIAAINGGGNTTWSSLGSGSFDIGGGITLNIDTALISSDSVNVI